MIDPRLLNGPFITVIEYENTKGQLSGSPIQTIFLLCFYDLAPVFLEGIRLKFPTGMVTSVFACWPSDMRIQDWQETV